MRRARALPPPVQQSTSPSLMVNTIDNKRVVTRDLYLINESGLCPGGNTVPRFGPDGKMLFSTVTIDASGSMVVPAGLTVGDDADICGSLDVGGDGRIHQDLTVDGDGQIGGDLTVSGDAIIYQNLDVSGDVNISGDLTVAGVINAVEIQVDGFMNISGELTVDRIHVRDFIDDATYETSVNTDRVRALEIFAGSESLNPPVYVTPGYQLDVSGAALVRETLRAKRVEVTDSMDVSGLASFQNVEVEGTLDVSGQATLQDLRVEGELDISGPMVFKNTVTIWGETDLCSNLDVVGSVTTGGNITVSRANDPAIAVQTSSGGLRGAMYWNSTTNELTFDTREPINSRPINLQGSYVNISSLSGLKVDKTVDAGDTITVTKASDPAVAVRTPGGLYGSMYWDTTNNKFILNTSSNISYPIELQGSNVNITSPSGVDIANTLDTGGNITVTKASNPSIAVKTPSGNYGSMYWDNTNNDKLVLNTAGNDYPIEIQGSNVNINTDLSITQIALNVNGLLQLSGLGSPIIPQFIHYKYVHTTSNNLSFTPPIDISWDTIEVDSNIYPNRLSSNVEWAAPVSGIYSVIVGICAHLANGGGGAVNANVVLRVGASTLCTPYILVNSFMIPVGDYSVPISTTQTYNLKLNVGDTLRVIFNYIYGSTDFFIDPGSTFTITLLQRTA